MGRLPMRREAVSFFAEMYRIGNPPWDIGRAQPAFVELANADEIKGRVMDLGCGTGDLALELAERGHDSWGVDIVAAAVRQCRAKMRLRDLQAQFLCGDALEVEHLRQRFDTVTDCGLFHIFSDPERQIYEQQLRRIVSAGGRLHIMAMSDWEDAGWGGPRRVSQQEILDTFGTGWKLDDIREARFLTRPGYPIRGHAWLASLRRDRTRSRVTTKKAIANAPASNCMPPDPGAAGPAAPSRRTVRTPAGI